MCIVDDLKKTETQGKKILLLECPAFVWYLNLVVSSGVTLFSLIMLIRFVWDAFLYPVIFFALLLACSLYWLFSLPRKIIVTSDTLRLIWPWKLWNIPLERIKSIRVERYRLRSYFIFIFLKHAKWFPFIPVRFDWNFSQKDFSEELKVISEIGKGSAESVSGKFLKRG